MIVLNLLMAFGLTYLIETCIALIMGYRGLQIYIVIFLVNIMTNPALNLIMQGVYVVTRGWQVYVILLFLEAVVVIIEWETLTYVYQKQAKKMLWLSIAMNAASFIGGLIIFRI